MDMRFSREIGHAGTDVCVGIYGMLWGEIADIRRTSRQWLTGPKLPLSLFTEAVPVVCSTKLYAVSPERYSGRSMIF